MDYWCSLWFWEYEDSILHPQNRADYWLDIQGIIGLSFSSAPTPKTPVVTETLPDLFSQDEETQVDEEVETVYTRQDAKEILEKYKSDSVLFEESGRIPIVQKLADRYHFFHPMLEFIEVFWLREGFDVIVGNPPWHKLVFEEGDLISDKYPEVSLRKISGPEIN